jgi:predicted RNA-binding Zn-ribbon protein involved in translation (DUF1610 family)
MFRRRQKKPAAPRIINCPFCGWTGGKSDLVIKVVEPDYYDKVSKGFYSIMLASPPSERVQYWCPRCGKMIASDLHYFSSLFDDDSYPE